MAHSWLEEYLKHFYRFVCSNISQGLDGIFHAVFFLYVTQRICSILHFEGKVFTIRPLFKKANPLCVPTTFFSLCNEGILCPSCMEIEYE